MPDALTVELTVPGLLQFRDTAVRVVMESCKLVGSAILGSAGQGSAAAGQRQASPPQALSERYDFTDDFTVAFTSAFQEIYNNISKHAYEGEGKGAIRLVITIARDQMIVDITDTGRGFDIDTVPLPDEIPVGGMGIHIARTMLDELDYRPGPPNHWRLVKHLPKAASEREAATD